MSQSTNVESLFSVKGTVAVITGGGSGIGAYIALALDVSIYAHTCFGCIYIV